jgi:pilus assembly protein FimV
MKKVGRKFIASETGNLAPAPQSPRPGDPEMKAIVLESFSTSTDHRRVPLGMPKRTHALILCSALSAPLVVSGAGFGRVTTVAVMGQPMVMSVPIRLDSGNRMSAECVSAEVVSGDSKLPANQVRVQVLAGPTDQDWVARVSTVGPVEEPVLVVSISAGCEQRFVRQFTAFADAPLMLATTRDTPDALTRSAAATRAVTAGGIEDLLLAPAPPTRPKPRVLRSAAAEAMPSSAPKVNRRVSATGPSKVASAQRVTPAPLVADAQVARLLLDVGGPRLKMDMEDPIMRVADTALASASDAALSGTGSDDFDRLVVLERSLATLRAESQASRDAAAALKTQLQESQSRSRLLPWLLALLVLTGGSAVWLAMRLRKKAQARAEGGVWWSSEHANLDAVGPVAVPPISVAGELQEEPLDSISDAELDSEEPRHWAAPDALDTAPMPGPKQAYSGSNTAVLEGNSPAREVSVEELMDLEQQADFFIALGQEDAAVDLLMSHLRSTGGQSPLPYTKLLEIYRRQGDRGAYERIRARFNRRFNAYAPDWDAGPLQGRSLEDYPALIEHLQGLWQSPIDAMAILENMLFRKDDSGDMFDLPAYKDVLLLYALARDLWQQGGMGVSEVDLLLPLGDTAPGAVGLAAASERPGVDYDLTSFQLEAPQSDAANDGEPATRHDQLN